MNGLIMLAISIVLVFIIRGFLFIPLSIDGISMEKNLKQGDHVITEKMSEIHRFDIIVFHLDDGKTYVKRVIGLPGEEIAYKKDQLYINGKKRMESFLTKNKEGYTPNSNYTNEFTTRTLLSTKQIPENCYFVLGDNRRLSKDSRSFGVVHQNQVFGKVVMIYYPFDRMQIIK